MILNFALEEHVSERRELSKAVVWCMSQLDDTSIKCTLLNMTQVHRSWTISSRHARAHIHQSRERHPQGFVQAHPGTTDGALMPSAQRRRRSILNNLLIFLDMLGSLRFAFRQGRHDFNFSITIGEKLQMQAENLLGS